MGTEEALALTRLETSLIKCQLKAIGVDCDVGGGRGQSLEAIKHDYPHLKGRLILQDLPDVIEDAKTNGLASFIEPRVGSFFEPQAIKGTTLLETSYFQEEHVLNCFLAQAPELTTSAEFSTTGISAKLERF